LNGAVAIAMRAGAWPILKRMRQRLIDELLDRRAAAIVGLGFENFFAVSKSVFPDVPANPAALSRASFFRQKLPGDSSGPPIFRLFTAHRCLRMPHGYIPLSQSLHQSMTFDLSIEIRVKHL